MFIPTNVATPDQIFKACTEVQSFLEAHYEADNPAACEDRGMQAEAYMALTSKMLADAKYHQDMFTNSAIASTIEEALKAQKVWSTSIINKKIDALCKDYNYLVNWCDRLNRSCTHALDFQRTLISKHKAEKFGAGKFSV